MLRLLSIFALINFAFNFTHAAEEFNVHEFNCAEITDEVSPSSMLFFFGKKENDKFLLSICFKFPNCEAWEVSKSGFDSKKFNLSAKKVDRTFELEILNQLDDNGKGYKAHFELDGKKLKALCEVKFIHTTEVNILIDEIKSNDPVVQLKALNTLIKLGSKAAPAVPELIKLLESKNDDVVDMAADVLGAIGPQAQAAIIPLVLTSQHKKFNIGTSVSLAIIGILKDGKVEAKKFTPELIKLLEHDSAKVRAESADTLGLFGNTARAALPNLIEGLEDSDMFVKEACIGAIGKMGDHAAEAVLPLMELLDRYWDQRPSTLISDSLSSISSPRIEDLDKIIDYLRDKRYTIAKSAIDVIQNMGANAEKALPTLVDGMKNYNLIDDIKKALASVGLEKAAPHLVQLLGDSELKGLAKTTVIFYIGTVKPKILTAVPVLIEMYKDGDASVRARVVQSLGKIGPAEAVLPTMIKATKDESEIVREYVTDRIGEFGPAAATAVPALIDLLDDSHKEVVWSSVAALGKIGVAAPGAISKFIAFLKNGDSGWYLREVCAISLGQFGSASKTALPVLKKIMNDPAEETRLRSIAKWAIEKIEQ